MNKRTANRMAKGNYNRPLGAMADYTPRNTTLDSSGNVRVRGEVVTLRRGSQITGNSFYTAKSA